MSKTDQIIKQTEHYGARNYHPLPIVITEAEGVWVRDPEGNRYMDMLSAYSAVNQGHRHPKIIQALKEQADKVTLTSRAFHNDQLGPWYEKVSKLTNKEMALPMNTGAEALETAFKAARRWAYDIKRVPDGRAEIIACEGNFHGRTMTAVSLSSEKEYQRGFGPLLPGLKLVPYGDLDALKKAINSNTAAFLIEPIQGEAGVILPPEGFLKEAYEVCKENQVLFIADEIQAGLGRSGKMFACDWDDIEPDMYILGKALGGGVFPISCVCADEHILGVFNPGSHGSTFGGNPLACAVSIAALEVIENENLSDHSLELGDYFMSKLREIEHPVIKQVRGRGLFIGVELHGAARKYCEALKEVIEVLKERVEHGIFGYTIVTGSLIEAILEWTKSRHDWKIEPEWLLMSPGVIPSVHTAIQAFTEPGDKILVQSPVYTPFFQMIERNGREITNSPLILKGQRYEVDFDDFEQKLKSGVKIFLLSSPHNPAGRVWSKEELSRMAELCKKYDVLIASDEIHSDLTSFPHKHVPIASLDDSYADITLTFMAPTKTFNLAGVQASFMVVPNKSLRLKLAAVQASDGFSMLNTFGAIAMEAAYKHGAPWLNEALKYIRSNIELVKEEIASSLPELEVIEPEGTYLIWIDCRKLGLTDAELKKRILEKGKLALNFGNAYGQGGEGFIRMNVACPKATVIEGLKRLRKAL